MKMLSESARERILDRVSKKAGDNEELSISCAQGTLTALQEEFNLGGGTDVLKAATFMPGVASRKETCGAFLGGLMALGLVFGRDKLYDPSYREPATVKEYAARKKRTAWKFCEELKKELGSTQCRDIHTRLMGREYEFMNPEDFQQFLKDGGSKQCRVPPEKAARIAAGIILEELGEDAGA